MTGFKPETIEFFKNVKSLLAYDENGNLDRENIRRVFLEDGSLTREKLWVCGLIPDFFHEGSLIFKDYCFYCLNITDYDKYILPKFKSGDFSVFKPYEEQYGYFQIASRFFNANIKKVHEETVRQLWDSKDFFTEELKRDIKRHRDVYDQIVSNKGWFKNYDDTGIKLFLDDGDEFIKELGVDRETIEFAYKICHLYKASHSLNGLCCFQEETEEEKENGFRDEDKKEMTILEQKIRKTRRKRMIDKLLFRNKDEQKDEEELENLKRALRKTKKDYNKARFSAEFLRQKREIIEGYRKKHSAISSKMLRSSFEEQVIPTLDGKAREDVEKLFNRIMEVCFLNPNFQEENSMPLYGLTNSFSYFENRPFDRNNDVFYNAIENIGKIANVVLEFDSMESKDFNSLINIIRNELAGVPIDFSHRDELSSEYRKDSLNPLFSKMGEMGQFKNIPQNMENLGMEFESLMSEENIDEYIKKVGIIWYKLIAIHPFMDGNGRTSRLFMNVMLAYKNIVVPSFFSTIDERNTFYRNLDSIINKSNDFNLLGESFLNTVKEEGFNLVDGNPLTPVQEKESQLPLVEARQIVGEKL